MKTYAHKIKKIVLWLIFLCSLAYIVYELRSFSVIWKEIKTVPLPNLCIAFFLLFILMLGNWIAESKKWQYLARKVIENYTFKTAFQTVLCGITLGLFTPNRVGEYGARLFYVENIHKTNLLLLAFIDRLAQLWVTILFGFVFLFIYVTDFLPFYKYFVLLSCTILIIFHILLLVFRNSVIAFIVSRKVLRKYFDTHLYISARDVIIVLGYASLRYCIFVIQYWLWGYYTDSFYIAEKGVICVNAMLLIKSVVPSAGLSELGIRESVLMYLYKSYGLSAVTAFHSALVVYAVNLLIPAMVGLFFMPRMALWKDKNNKTE